MLSSAQRESLPVPAKSRLAPPSHYVREHTRFRYSDRANPLPVSMSVTIVRDQTMLLWTEPRIAHRARALSPLTLQHLSEARNNCERSARALLERAMP